MTWSRWVIGVVIVLLVALGGLWWASRYQPPWVVALLSPRQQVRLYHAMPGEMKEVVEQQSLDRPSTEYHDELVAMIQGCDSQALHVMGLVGISNNTNYSPQFQRAFLTHLHSTAPGLADWARSKLHRQWWLMDHIQRRISIPASTAIAIGNRGQQLSETGLRAIFLISLACNGFDHVVRSTYQPAAQQMLDELLAGQHPDGRCGQSAIDHILATLAISEMSGLTRDVLLRQPLLRALRALADAVPESLLQTDPLVAAWAIHAAYSGFDNVMERDPLTQRWLGAMTEMTVRQRHASSATQGVAIASMEAWSEWVLPTVVPTSFLSEPASPLDPKILSADQDQWHGLLTTLIVAAVQSNSELAYIAPNRIRRHVQPQSSRSLGDRLRVQLIDQMAEQTLWSAGDEGLLPGPTPDVRLLRACLAEIALSVFDR